MTLFLMPAVLTHHRYKSKTDAFSLGLAQYQNGKAYMGVDYTHQVSNWSATGRPSVRIETSKSYTHGLFIADIEHMPNSVCGM
jgi:hypothetical protein